MIAFAVGVATGFVMALVGVTVGIAISKIREGETK